MDFEKIIERRLMIGVAVHDQPKNNVIKYEERCHKGPACNLQHAFLCEQLDQRPRALIPTHKLKAQKMLAYTRARFPRHIHRYQQDRQNRAQKHQVPLLTRRLL